jgi:uncharacterized membrane protein YdjX (TVP38/TMEM64 family)
MPKPPAVKLGVFIAVLAVAAVVAWRLGFFQLTHPATLARAVRSVRAQRLAGPLFVAAYAIAIMFGLPGSAFTLAGGAIFGFWWGLLLNWLGATVGATLAFLFAHSLCGDACRSLLGRYSTRLEQAAQSHGLMATLRLRLIPLVPFNLLNFGAALAGVRFRDYVIATAIGIIPGTAVYTYFADSLLSGAAGANRHALLNVSVAGALLLALSFVPTLMRKVRTTREHTP